MFHERRFPIEEANTKNDFVKHSMADNSNCIAMRVGYDAITLHDFDGSDIVKRATLPLKHGYRSVGDNFVVSPDGEYVATYKNTYPDHWDTIKLWDTHTGQLVHEYTLRVEYPINRCNPSFIDLSFRADGKQLVALTELGEVAIWSTINGNLLRFVGGNSVNTHTMALSHDGSWFVSLDDNADTISLSNRRYKSILFVGRYVQSDKQLYGWSTNFQYFLERLFYHVRKGETSQPSPMRLSSHEKWVGEVEIVVFKMWDAYSGAPIRDFALHKPENDIASRTHDSRIHSFTLSHDDTLLAGIANQALYIWNTLAGDIVQTITLDTVRHILNFSQDDRYLICYDTSHIHLWDVEQQSWTTSYNLAGQLRSVMMSDTDRISATVWNGEHWEIAIIDLDFSD